MAQETASLKISVDSRDVKNADKDLNKFEQSSRKTQKSSDQLNTSFSSLKVSAIGLASSLVGLYSMNELSKAFLRNSDAATQMNSKLKLVTTSAENLDAVQRRLFNVAQDSNAVYTDTVELYARLARSTKQLGTPQKDLLTITETINKAMIVSGATTQEASNSVFQLSQAFMGGTLRAEEYNSIIDQAPRLLQAMADSANMSMGEFRQAMLDGQISSEFMAKALVDQASTIDSEYAKMGKTIGNSMVLVKNSLLDLVDTMERDFKIGSTIASETQEMSKWITQNKAELIDWAQDIKAVGTLVADGLENIYLATQMAYAEFYLMFQKEIDTILKEIIDTVNQTGSFWADLFGKDFTPLEGLRLDVEATTKLIKENNNAILENEKSSNKAWLELATGAEKYKENINALSDALDESLSYKISDGGRFFSKDELEQEKKDYFAMIEEIEAKEQEAIDARKALVEDAMNMMMSPMDAALTQFQSLEEAMISAFGTGSKEMEKFYSFWGKKIGEISKKQEDTDPKDQNKEYQNQLNTLNDISGSFGNIAMAMKDGSKEQQAMLVTQKAISIAAGITAIAQAMAAGDGYTAVARGLAVAATLASFGWQGGGGGSAPSYQDTIDQADFRGFGTGTSLEDYSGNFDKFIDGLDSAAERLENFGNDAEAIALKIASLVEARELSQKELNQAKEKFSAAVPEFGDLVFGSKFEKDVNKAKKALEDVNKQIAEIQLEELSENLDLSTFSVERLKKATEGINKEEGDLIKARIEELALLRKTSDLTDKQFMTQYGDELGRLFTNEHYQGVVDFADGFEKIDEALENSKSNTKAWEDLFKTPMQLLAEQASTLSYTAEETYKAYGLINKYIGGNKFFKEFPAVIQTTMNGLDSLVEGFEKSGGEYTDAEWEFVEANYEMIKSSDDFIEAMSRRNESEDERVKRLLTEQGLYQNGDVINDAYIDTLIERANADGIVIASEQEAINTTLEYAKSLGLVVDAQAELKKIEDERKRLLGQIFDLIASENEQREKTLNSLDASNRIYQEFIYAIEDAVDANKKALEVEQEKLDQTLKNISSLESVFDSLGDVIDKLRGESRTADQNLNLFYTSMSKAKSLVGGNVEEYSEAISDAISRSSALFETSNFQNQRDMDFAQLVAANQFEGLEDATLDQIDYLQRIEENTRGTVLRLEYAINNLGMTISDDFQSVVDSVVSTRPEYANVVEEAYKEAGVTQPTQTTPAVNNTSIIQSAFQTALGRQAQEEGLNYWGEFLEKSPDTSESALSVLVARGANNEPDVYKAVKWLAQNTNSSYGQTLAAKSADAGIISQSAFLDMVYKYGLGRAPDSGKQYWLDQNLSAKELLSLFPRGAEVAGEKYNSFAVGTPNVPYDMMANIHKGEGIIPATFNQGIQNGDYTLGNNKIMESMLQRIESIESRQLRYLEKIEYNTTKTRVQGLA